MAEGKDYEEVLTEEEDPIKVPFEGAEEESKEATGRSSEENLELELLQRAHERERREFHRNRARENLLEMVQMYSYEMIKEEVTAKALMNFEEDTLLLALEVSEKLRLRATTERPYKDNFHALAEQVEEFILRFLDPLYGFLAPNVNSVLDLILETGTKLRVKKFFEHPAVDTFMSERWLTSRGITWKTSRPGLWLFLNIWCLVDVVLFPLSFSMARWLFGFLYEEYFTIPYFVFVRDMISYLALLALHFAICLESSQLPLSHLEWVILVFFFGRLLMEGKQMKDTARSKGGNFVTAYLYHFISDPWNLVDVSILGMYFFGILPLRINTWTSSESPSNNQNLESAGYLYAVNTILLTFRVFGSFLEVFESVGTIQIALFQIIKDAFVVAVHFVVIIVAFSSAITKVFRASPGIQQDTKKYSWMGITSQLSLSLLELSDGLDYFRSADSSSETFAHWLFALYLVMALILLVNMLIALLSNTYQKVQDNSRREWIFKRTLRIQTYSNYDPIPVPFNIISMFLMLFPCLWKKKETRGISLEDEESEMDHSSMYLLIKCYKRRYGTSFPLTEQLHQMTEETNNTESMVFQILEKTFRSNKALLPTGPEAWETNNFILVEGCLLTCQPPRTIMYDKEYITCFGAKYRSNFSPRFPNFEMMILESVDVTGLSFGVVPESWDCGDTPGQKKTVGFHTDLKIFDFDYEPIFMQDGVMQEPSRREEKEVTGVSRIRQGDIIRCIVMFEHEEERDGEFHVPVRFTVNGTTIERQGYLRSPSSQRFIKSKPDDLLYPFIGFSNKSSVLAKMCARDDVDYYQDLQLQEVKSELTEAKGELSEVKLQLNDVKVQLCEATSKLEEKLDALLTKDSEKQNE